MRIIIERRSIVILRGIIFIFLVHIPLDSYAMNLGSDCKYFHESDPASSNYMCYLLQALDSENSVTYMLAAFFCYVLYFKVNGGRPKAFKLRLDKLQVLNTSYTATKMQLISLLVVFTSFGIFILY